MNQARAKLNFLWPMALVVALALWLLGPIEQDPTYHNFADQRALAGIPHFQNVLSNLPFLLVGCLGLLRLVKSPVSGARRLYWATFFAGVGLVALGSSYYHLSPSDATLLWDRLPMTIAFMALFTLVIDERMGRTAASRSFPLLLLAGLASVLVWRFGTGDLRLYAFVQFFPMLAMPLMISLLPGTIADRRRTQLFFWAIAAYALAKVLEATDRSVFDQIGVTSGHALKHLAAAAATGLLFGMFQREQTGCKSASDAG